MAGFRHQGLLPVVHIIPPRCDTRHCAGASAELTILAMTNHRAWVWMAILVSSSVLLGCGKPACQNDALLGLPSPDGALIVFVFRRHCAAPAAVSTQVSVIGFHESLHDEPGNILSVPDEQAVKVSWRGPHELAVTGFKNPIYQRTEPIHSVVIKYP
jgi:hypothetical protein